MKMTVDPDRLTELKEMRTSMNSTDAHTVVKHFRVKTCDINNDKRVLFS